MKRPDLIRYLEKHDCTRLREGGKHTVYANLAEMKVATVPQPREIDEFLTRKICRELAVREPA